MLRGFYVSQLWHDEDSTGYSPCVNQYARLVSPRRLVGFLFVLALASLAANMIGWLQAPVYLPPGV